MTGALDFATLADLAGNKSPADCPCPLCGPHSSNPRKRVLRIWREAPDFVRFNCARCGEHGSASDCSAPRLDNAELGLRIGQRAARAVTDIEQISAKAMRLWRRTLPADPQHPYLVRKRVRPHGIGQIDDCLVVPVQWPAKLTGLQFISPDGTKRFMSGTIKKGAYHILGDPSLRPEDCIVFAEGYATAATIREACGVTAVCAFDAGNLKPAAERLRRIFPASEFVFAEDRDEAGRSGCHAAALATDGKIMSMEPRHG
jgi:phage/plasmid primase-like uncharacterized protein